MAAGFSMEKRNLARLREKMNANCTLDEKLLTPKLRIDVPMPLDYVSISLTEELEVLEPFGKGNEKPVFAQSGVRVKSARIMGKRQNVLRVSFLMENGGTIEGISFDPRNSPVGSNLCGTGYTSLRTKDLYSSNCNTPFF